MAMATASFQHDDNQTSGYIISVEDDSQLQEASLDFYRQQPKMKIQTWNDWLSEAMVMNQMRCWVTNTSRLYR